MSGKGDSKDSLELILKDFFPRNHMKVKSVCWMACTCFSFSRAQIFTCMLNKCKMVLTSISDFEDKSFLLSVINKEVTQC